MKPDWSTAPDWANWIAMDCEYDWYWYEEKPMYDKNTGWWKTTKRKSLIENYLNSEESLEEKPK